MSFWSPSVEHLIILMNQWCCSARRYSAKNQQRVVCNIKSVSVRAVRSIFLDTKISLISCVLQDIHVPIIKPQSVWSDLFIFQSFTEIKFHLGEGLSWHFSRLPLRTTLEVSIKQTRRLEWILSVHLSHTRENRSNSNFEQVKTIVQITRHANYSSYPFFSLHSVNQNFQ